MVVYSIAPDAPTELMSAEGTVGAKVGNTFAVPQHCTVFNWGTSFSAVPTSVTIKLEGSMDGVVWTQIDQTTNTGGEMKATTVGWSPVFIRANKTAQVGAGAVTVIIKPEWL